MKINPGIQGGLSLDGDPEHIRDYYRQWANQYDEDVKDGGYQAFAVMLECLQRVMRQLPFKESLANTEIAIHDAGCGTGMVGAALYEAGYRNLYGSDLSQAMVDQAQKRGIYRELTGGVDLTQPIKREWQRAYDLVMCCGVFTCGHVPPSTVTQLCAMTKPGGVVILSTRTSYFEDSAYQQTHDEIVADGLVRSIDILRDAPYTDDGNSHYWSYEVL